MIVALKPQIISTLIAIAGLGLLWAVVGFTSVDGNHTTSDTRGHAHVHTHDGYTHAHWHTHAAIDGHACSEVVAGDDSCDHSLTMAALPLDPHHGCCHEDHWHPTPIYALINSGPRWSEHAALITCALPTLWQPEANFSPVIKPLLPPPRCSPSDPIYQLRTVVLLT